MKKTNKFIAIAATAAFCLLNMTTNAQQLKVPAPSPAQTIKQAFALSDVTIEYSRPSMKGRVIFGDLVAYGKPWRTGANGSTKITFADDVKIEGTAVSAGTYALYTIPNKDTWEIILNKDLTLGGNTDGYKKENDVLHITVKANTAEEKIETFTIDMANMAPTSMYINLIWDKTRVGFNVTTDIDAKVMKAIETNVMKDNRPYFQAASYYYDNNKDLKLAGEWADKALANNPKAYWIALLKGKIQLKAGDKKGAGVTANLVITLAKEDKNDDYVKMGEALLADSKK